MSSSFVLDGKSSQTEIDKVTECVKAEKSREGTKNSEKVTNRHVERRDERRVRNKTDK